ncbi:lipopolysaccharide biosynthesis protein [Streptacidiphilus cavernicola]|uniref:Lipopolysaccharide biosynthesis protein n=1 Tax=Streptacidiphilus cavernicola TaxID=3342716 RepID=A0ABV6VTW2_9ACTN
MSGALTRVFRAIPAGTHLVIGGTIVLGVASYVQISVAGYGLDRTDTAAMSSLWTLVMTLSLGVFFPVEQELTRLVAARVVRGEGVAPVFRRAGLVTLGMIAVFSLLIAVAQRPLADRLLGGNTSLVWAFAASLVGIGLAYLTRGMLAGMGRFTAYGSSLAIEGTLRILLAVALLAAGVHSVLAYGLVLAVAPLLAMLCTLPATLRGCGPGPVMPWSELFQNMGMMICAQVLAQFAVNAAVLSVALLAPADADLRVAILNAGVLCRVPLFVFGSLQPTLMTGLSTAATAQDGPAFRRMLLQTCAVVSGLGLLGGVPAVLLGPWLIRVLFHGPSLLGPMDLFWFSAGTVFYMIALVLGQALLALQRHRIQLVSWMAGTAVLLGTTAVPGDVATRVELAYFLGPVATSGFMLMYLFRTFGKRAQGSTAEVHVEGKDAYSPNHGPSVERIR